MEPVRPRLEESTEELRLLLGSRMRGVGYRAAEALARRGEAGQEVLQAALQSGNRNARLHASWAVRLMDSPEAVRRVLELLRDDREFFLAAQQAVARRAWPELGSYLLDLARDRSNPNRKFHAMLLGDAPGLEVLDALLMGLQGDDPDLQDGCFLALKHAPEELRRKAAPALVQALSVRLPLPHRRPLAFTRRARALRDVPLLLMAAVGFSAGDLGVGVLAGIARSEADLDYRHAALSALVSLGEPAVARTWRLLLALVGEGGDTDLPDSAAEALRRMRVPEAEPALLELLAGGTPLERRNAAHALEGCGSSEAAPALHGRLCEDPEVHVRRTCARTLGVLLDPRSPGFLTRALGDRDALVGWNAAWALGQYGDPGLVPRLRSGLEARDPRLARNSAEALGHLGLSLPEAQEGLVRALSRGGAVARSAAWALRQLDLAAALGYAVELLESPDGKLRRLGQRARYWLQPERASYAPHLPLRSSHRGGVYSSPPRKSREVEKPS